MNLSYQDRCDILGELPQTSGVSFLSVKWKAVETAGSDDLVRSFPALSLLFTETTGWELGKRAESLPQGTLS